MDTRHPNPEVNRELQELYDALPAYEKIVWDALQDVHKGDEAPDWSPHELPEPVFTVWAISMAQETTNNGGFQYFFENNWVGTPHYHVFVDAFERIGAEKAARAIRSAVEEFPFIEPHLDFSARREFMESSRSAPGKYDSIIDKWGEELMSLNDQNYKLLSAFVEEHLGSFPTVQRRLPKK